MTNELYQIDCNEYMKDIPDKHFDLAIVDPPYGIGDFNIKTRLHKGKRVEANSLPVVWNNVIPVENYFNELLRISKKQIIWGANYYNCFTEGGALIWHKGKRQDLFSQCEIASLSFQKKVDYVLIEWQSGWARKTYEKNYDAIHPCQKPISLYKWLLTYYAKPGWLLLDTHSGSGSLREAAYDMGFDLVSCELDPDYCRDNEARFQRHIQQHELFTPEEIQEKIYTQGEL